MTRNDTKHTAECKALAAASLSILALVAVAAVLFLQSHQPGATDRAVLPRLEQRPSRQGSRLSPSTPAPHNVHVPLANVGTPNGASNATPSRLRPQLLWNPDVLAVNDRGQ